MLVLIMWSANGLSRTAKKKRGLFADFFLQNSKSFRILAQYVASQYTQAFQKIQGMTFFFKKKSRPETITTNSQHPIIGDMSKNERNVSKH